MAEDLCQETLLKCLRSTEILGRCDNPYGLWELRRWVFGVERHTLIDHYRAAARRPSMSPLEDADRLAGGVDLEKRLDDADALMRLRREARLSDEEWRMFYLKYGAEGLTHSEIGRLRCPHNWYHLQC